MEREKNEGKYRPTAKEKSQFVGKCDDAKNEFDILFMSCSHLFLANLQ